MEISKRVRHVGFIGGVIVGLAILFFVLTYHTTTVEVMAAETDEIVSYDLDQNVAQTETYTDANGETGTATIESVITPNLLKASIGSGTREYKITYKDAVTKTWFYIKCKKVGSTGEIKSAYGLKYKTVINKVDSYTCKRISSKKAQAELRFSNPYQSYNGYYGVKVSGSKLIGFHD
ncbi:DUF5626 family protein [Listeria monocytogenes]|uniref:DUF5626 family protein n=1 Tax=Listeria monocytogenes TaxID=1639 RepID=UPI000BDF9A48|nr:DUF5626 family protein [Listeria monocytogenes]PCT95864.1 hypothetical protein A7O90_01850 [Listeria monocytogenes]HAB0001696.1 hypothetical protein [Listeria monocytogenes]HAC2236555.1 hypothetical protein [Listeria monocytogenes]HAC2277994.1 hypothetical protein [Listeria monocytogenes]